jgi:hypothetical protein
MFTYWIAGFIGGLAMVVGGLLMLAGIFKTELFVFGIVICAAGSFLRYISKQTNQSINHDTGSKASVSVAIAPATGTLQNNSVAGKNNSVVDKIFSKEDAVLENDEFKIFLVKKYNIHKDPTLEKYVFNNKLYESLDESLDHAKNFYLAEVASA